MKQQTKQQTRYTLTKTPRREKTFEHIWELYPRLRGDYSGTIQRALDLMADGVVSVGIAHPDPVVGRGAVTIAPEPPMEVEEEFDLLDDIEI
jgi:hypothetical protein